MPCRWPPTVGTRKISVREVGCVCVPVCASGVGGNNSPRIAVSKRRWRPPSFVLFCIGVVWKQFCIEAILAFRGGDTTTFSVFYLGIGVETVYLRNSMDFVGREWLAGPPPLLIRAKIK